LRSLGLAIGVLVCDGLGCGDCEFKCTPIAPSDDGGLPDLICPTVTSCEPQCPHDQPTPGDYCDRPSKVCWYETDLAYFCEQDTWVIDCYKSAPRWCRDLSVIDLSIDDLPVPDDAAEPVDGPTDGTDDALSAGD
jgi:hypothetical protein